MSEKKKKSTVKDLLHDENIRRWYDNTTRGSKLNADIGLHRLNLFCYRTNTTPSSLVKIGKKMSSSLKTYYLIMCHGLNHKTMHQTTLMEY